MAEEKNILIKRISNILSNKNYIPFAYIFGSFTFRENFKDIDVGIFISILARLFATF
jgi:predicted nucleotidyltransferase